MTEDVNQQMIEGLEYAISEIESFYNLAKQGLEIDVGEGSAIVDISLGQFRRLTTLKDVLAKAKAAK